MVKFAKKINNCYGRLSCSVCKQQNNIDFSFLSDSQKVGMDRILTVLPEATIHISQKGKKNILYILIPVNKGSIKELMTEVSLLGWRRISNRWFQTM